VEFLVEICPPTGYTESGYLLDGVLVSDFYLPDYFTDTQGRPGTRYWFNGSVKRPQELLPGGYLSWRDPATGRWKQVRDFGGKQEIYDLGSFGAQPKAAPTTFQRSSEPKESMREEKK
jgi:hypothetical protein